MFELKRRTPMPEYGGEACLYVHDVTGMEVFHIKNCDTERCCNFMFSTPSEDSKGVAHIIEHTVLCGSKRFPVKDPFSQVLLSSPNTFLNAITFTDKTMYPFASPLKKDFDILFDIYSDAVFAPLLRRESFLQEGIRAFDGKFDGVVFNEMCGARSTEDSVVQSYSTRDMFRGTPYEYDSGGDPINIVDLTYEEYLERYRKWYSPSNCRLFLYGDLDACEYLDKVEQRYLKGREKGEKIIPKSADYLMKELKPMRVHENCPAGDARSVVLTWLTTEGDDTLEVLTVSTLVDILLGNPGAPLYKAITESDLGDDLNPLSGTDVDSPVLTFTVGFSHAKEGAESEIESFILDQISSYVIDGLPEDAVAAAIKRLEFKEQEIPSGGLPFGMTICLKVARSWMRGKDPHEGALSLERLSKLKERVAAGRYFESWMQRHLLDNPRRCLLTVESSDDFDTKFREELQRKYSEKVSAGLDTSRQKALFDRFVNTPDTPEALATIDRITLSDLPRTIARYDQSKKRLPCGTVFYDYRLFTRGIVYLSIAFDTRNLSLEEKKLLPLLVRAVQMCGTKKHSFTQISTMMKMLTGSFFMYPSAGADVHRNPVSTVVVKSKSLKADFAGALDLISELLTECELSDTQRIQASLTDMITEFESGYTYSGNSYAVMNASSVFSASAYESEINMGTSLWLYLAALKKDLESGKTSLEALSAELTKLRKKVFVQRSMTIHIGHDAEDEELTQLVGTFADRFEAGKFVRTSDYYSNHKTEKPFGSMKSPLAFTVPSGPAFNALAVSFNKEDEKKYVAASLLASVLSSGYLWDTVRGKMGAYGVESHVDGMENLFVFSSYRDPGIGDTYKVFRKALRSSIDPVQMEYAIVTIIGKEIRPLSPQAKSAEAFRRVLYGMSTSLYLKRRRLLLQMSASDLENVAKEILGTLASKGSATVVCGLDMTRNQSLLKSVALPI